MSASGPNADITSFGRISRLISQVAKQAEQAFAITRQGPYGETVVEALTGKQQKLADEGSLYITRTPTIATGVASIAAPTAYVATSPYIIVANGNPQGGKNIWLDRINLLLLTPGTLSTDLQIATAIDPGSPNRYTSGGSGGAGTNIPTNILAGPYPTNTGAPQMSQALVYAGALVAAAASNQNRILINRKLRTAIAVANDNYEIVFGGSDHALDGVLVSGAAIAQRSIAHPAVCIAPQTCFLLHLYGTGMTAATTCEVEVHHVER